MGKELIEKILGVSIEGEHDEIPCMLSEESLKEISKMPKEMPEQISKQARDYIPTDPGRPWRDFYVQQNVRLYLQTRVLRYWIDNHPHKPCSNIRVDEWGRWLCRYITPTNGVDGPWENPTHFVFYAYNQYQPPAIGQLNDFLRSRGIRV
jgi:hypothetical protein